MRSTEYVAFIHVFIYTLKPPPSGLLVGISVTMQKRLYMYLHCCQIFSPELTNILQSCYHRDHLSCRLKFVYIVHVVLMLIYLYSMYGCDM